MALPEGLLLLMVLYAEIHYCLPGIFSRLKIPEPEIIADAPHRVEPGLPVPVVVLIKDAHLYPIFLHEIQFVLTWPGGESIKKVDLKDERVALPMWHRLHEIEVPTTCSGKLQIDVTLRFTVNGKTRKIRNDNYVGTSHDPLEVYVAGDPLPKTAGWHFGEFHCHSSYTSDQVEFGAPLPVTRELAASMGLSFCCVTDHSYDLDDEADDFLTNDPELGKWKSLWQEALELNRQNTNFLIVPGEEVSVGNHKNRNVHFLVLNNPEYFPGDGDGAERWFRTSPSCSIQDVLERSNSNSATFAAHPTVRPPLLERLLIRRGQWEAPDFENPRLHGLQVWNGTDKSLADGQATWVNLLLQGKRLFLTAGNDAHGNFNRFRQIGFPFWTMREGNEHIFGKVRTAVYLDEPFSTDVLLRAIRAGKMVVTDGPFIDLTIKDSNGRRMLPGAGVFGERCVVELKCLSTEEFGELDRLRLLVGNLRDKEEVVEMEKVFSAETFTHEIERELTNCTDPLYVRAELYSATTGETFRCLTNPVWLNEPQ